MADFDFDELDKAVNGALGGVSEPTTPVNTTPAPITPSPVVPAESSPFVVPPRPEPVASVAAPTPAARRSTGRFMDMVHPSSVMRGRPEATPVANAPLATTVNETPVDVPASQAPQVVNVPGVTSIPEVVSEEVPATLESPFLPDAKVEKRPLGGGFPDELTLEDLKPDLTNLASQLDESENLGSADQAIEPQQTEQDRIEAPEELGALTPAEPEVLIEKPATEQLLDSPEAEELIQEVEPQGQLEASEEVASIPPVSSAPELSANSEAPSAAAPVADTTPPPIVGPASITQQYTEQPSSTQATGAIFDTESYHQPISTPAKKKSAFWVVLWIILLIIAGAGAGAAFYVYVLPML